MTMATQNPFMEFILEPSGEQDNIVYKDYVSGSFTVKCVPYIKKTITFGPQNDELFISSDVLYKVTKLIQLMNESGKKEISYKN